MAARLATRLEGHQVHLWQVPTGFGPRIWAGAYTPTTSTHVHDRNKITLGKTLGDVLDTLQNYGPGRQLITPVAL
jgi:hypothetical protein